MYYIRCLKSSLSLLSLFYASDQISSGIQIHCLNTGDQTSKEQNRDISFVGNNNNDKDENEQNHVYEMNHILNCEYQIK